ncbi:MAG: EAL domain-containing protein [Nocardioides sp.]|uniref:putative bifunctional diguanylate cyclase/phosphodiesterase n=1 Tax=Nocardioides sp. TaxID=35761 RepID=UPI0039E321C1
MDQIARRRWRYHLVIFLLGMASVAVAISEVVASGGMGWKATITMVFCVPLIAIVARFPMVLGGAGGIEVGFDSSILMFLMCALDVPQALVVWAAGVVLTQSTASKPLSSKVFNIGIGILAAALAAVVFVIGGGDVGTLQGLGAVAAAAATYFLSDYVLSAVSIAILKQTPVHVQLTQRGVLMAIACFVPFDSLGYLGAVVDAATPWWTLGLFAVPLATLLIATSAVTRGRENARRLAVLFDAAVRAQSLVDREAVVAGLLRDAGELLRLDGIELRERGPGAGEIAVRVELGSGSQWLVAPARDRPVSDMEADEQALRALGAVASDAISRLELTEEMIHVARHDPLTDLPNRGILLDRVTQALTRARRRHDEVALLFIDLDGFKPVNDQFGHATGDRVLVELAGRLRACVRAGDTVARLGGDEFAILLEDLRVGDAPRMCDRVLQVIGQGAEIDGQHVALGASIGLVYGTGEDTAAGLLRNADLAMYEAKARGKGRFVEYEPAIGRARLERLALVDDLHRAVERGEIEVVYQPVVSVESGRMAGVEALARWRRDDVPVTPEVFIAAAEETGLIVPLGESVMARVAADVPAIRAVAGTHLTVSVNISAGQLRHRGFVDTVAGMVTAMGDTGLVLEITERQGVDLDPEMLDVMRAVTGMGAVFAIDDFGVGFSSISYLHDLPADLLKADASLSAGIDRDERARALLRSVVLMGRALGFGVVVEGIERESQLAVVAEDAPEAYVQGYLLHRPMPLHRLLEVMEEERDNHRAAQA